MEGRGWQRFTSPATKHSRLDKCWLDQMPFGGSRPSTEESHEGAKKSVHTLSRVLSPAIILVLSMNLMTSGCSLSEMSLTQWPYLK